MAEMTTLERALRILLRLSTYDNVTVDDLHRVFDGRESKRAIDRTLKAIQNANIPLEISKGPHNTFHYTLRRGFNYTPQLLDPDEVIAAMLLAPFASTFAGSRIGDDLHGLFDKIRHLVPKDSVAMSSGFQGPQDVIHIHNAGSPNPELSADILRPLFRAILERREIVVEYQSRVDHTSKFRARPYSLLLHRGAMYSVVHVPKHDNFIYLALHRVRDLNLTNDVFDRDPEFSLTKFLADNFGLWHAEPVDVRIRFNATVANAIRERTWHPSQTITDLDDGCCELTMHVGPTEELIAWILRWGEHAELLAPSEMRDDLRNRLAGMLSMYTDGGL
ncbi:WYL domain-containing protein [bacterium]|nr:WYL domain-containing protein [bacterium]